MPIPGVTVRRIVKGALLVVLGVGLVMAPGISVVGGGPLDHHWSEVALFGQHGPRLGPFHNEDLGVLVTLGIRGLIVGLGLWACVQVWRAFADMRQPGEPPPQFTDD